MDTLPTRIDTPLEAFRLAVSRAGGQIKFGKLVDRTQGAISKRLSKGEWLWPEFVLTVEAATGISRHDLRPDIYPIETNTAGPKAAGILPSSPAGPAVGSACPTVGHASSGEAA